MEPNKATKMKRRGNVKNPCKICHQRTNKKTGVQCQGACKKWSHFTCLKYTPGKIMDLKSGQITVTCPCLDCDLSEPKCQDLNKNTPIPLFPQQDLPMPRPLKEEPVNITNVGFKLKKSQQPKESDLYKVDSFHRALCNKQTCPKQIQSPPNPEFNFDDSGLKSEPQRNNVKLKTNAKVSASCSCLSADRDCSNQCTAVSSSDSSLPLPNQVLLTKLEQMCNTVGNLSLQIKKLMCRIVEGKRYYY